MSPSRKVCREIRVNEMLGRPGSKTQTRWGGMKESSSKVAPWQASWRMPAKSNSTANRSPIQWRCKSPSCCPGPRITGVSQGQRGSAGAVCTTALHQQLARRHRQIGPLNPGRVRGPQRSALIADDSQVVSLALAKRYAERLEPTGAVVRLELHLEQFPLRSQNGSGWIHSGSALHLFGGSSA